MYNKKKYGTKAEMRIPIAHSTAPVTTTERGENLVHNTLATGPEM